MNEFWGECMRKHELLVPAGNMECLRQAVFHGADAVYLACKNFGARKFATNFTNEEIVDAIHFCHLYGVKIYITMNTLIRDSEVSSFIDQARFLHQNGVDALIVQDLGMIYLLRQMFPNLEIHASTQANNTSYETCRMFYNLGVKRVVYSRELSVDEIDAIDVPIEKEAFIHGALCVSYSGCCLMSSMLGGRSGNRGECAGSCRLPYSLKKGNKVIEKNKYLLSMKELNTSSEFQRLLDSSIYSFKIEGRMKGPVYVGFITSFYRKLIDGIPFDLEEETNQLKTIFNREFTLGHLFGVEGKNIINSKSPNHIGLKIGKASILKNKIKIILDSNQELRQFDSIRFLHSNKGMVVNYLYDEKDKLCSSSKTVCYVDNKVGLDQDDILMKTQDALLEKETILDKPSRGIPINFSVIAKIGSPIKITITDGEREFIEEGGVVEKSLNSPVTEEVLTEKLSKLGDTPFKMNTITFDLDSSIFIPMKELNELRRSLVLKLTKSREEGNGSFVEREVSFSKNPEDQKSSLEYSCLVRNEEQLLECLNLSFNRIYVVDKDLYEKYSSNPGVYYYVGRCLSRIENSIVDRSLVGDTFSCNNKNVYGTYALNVTNSYTAYYLKSLGYLNIPLSVELTKEEMKKLISNYKEKFGDASFEILSYGRVENMIINSNILDLEQNDYSYSLIDFKDREFPVYYDGVMTHIYNYEKILVDNDLGNVCYFFDFYQESPFEISRIVKKFQG